MHIDSRHKSEIPVFCFTTWGLPVLGRDRGGTLRSKVKGSGEMRNDFEVDGHECIGLFFYNKKAVPLLT